MRLYPFALQATWWYTAGMGLLCCAVELAADGLAAATSRPLSHLSLALASLAMADELPTGLHAFVAVWAVVLTAACASLVLILPAARCVCN
jgi:hypothetical protein